MNIPLLLYFLIFMFQNMVRVTVLILLCSMTCLERSQALVFGKAEQFFFIFLYYLKYDVLKLECMQLINVS